MLKQFLACGPHNNNSGLDSAEWPVTVCQLTVVFTHANQGGMHKDIHQSCEKLQTAIISSSTGKGLKKLWYIYSLEYRASKKEQNNSKDTNKKTLSKLFPEKVAALQIQYDSTS